jgi:hypothetical protein
LKRGHVYHTVIEHDPDCTFFDGGSCNCIPDMCEIGPDGVAVIDERGHATMVARQWALLFARARDNGDTGAGMPEASANRDYGAPEYCVVNAAPIAALSFRPRVQETLRHQAVDLGLVDFNGTHACRRLRECACPAAES